MREAEGPSGWTTPGFPFQPGVGQLLPGITSSYLLMSSGSLCHVGFRGMQVSPDTSSYLKPSRDWDLRER